MKILYAAFRRNPLDPLAASSAHYYFFKAMEKMSHEVKIIGPFIDTPLFTERALKKIYNKSKDKRYIKYKWSNTFKASKALNEIDLVWKPDLIFTMTPSPLFFYRGKTPCIFRTDTTFLGMNNQGAQFLNHDLIMLKQMVWQEKKAFSKCAKIITHSKWSKQVLIEHYGINEKKISYFPNPAAIQHIKKDELLNIKKAKNLNGPLRLLIVGRDFHRKGIDIAIGIVNKLNEQNTLVTLSIVGLLGKDGLYHKYYGNFNKTDPNQYNNYIQFYQNAHLLLHPARFDASPIVTSEAAAFGLPTITNNNGGLATSVIHGISGIVLPKNTNTNSYVNAIQHLINNPKRYTRLCESTRKRYEKELNWNQASKILNSIIYNAVK